MRSIRRRCACGCGEITNYGSRYIRGHHTRDMSEETKQKVSLARKGMKFSEEHKQNLSLSHKNLLAHKHSKETKLKMSLSRTKSHPEDQYCEVWRDRGYKKDLRKDYCENEDCRGEYKRLVNHHINLNKKDCRPVNVMTLCNSCHTTLHCIFRQIDKHSILTIIRKDHITYIHKRTRQVTATITRIQK